MTSHIEFDADTAAKHLHEFSIAVKQRYEGNAELVHYYDKEMVDINHMIELTNFNASKGYELVKKLQDNRRRRRACKNENMLLQPLYEFITKGEGNILNALTKLIKSTEHMKVCASNQQYQPRTDLFTKDQYHGKIGIKKAK